MTRKRIYFDNAATTPLNKTVLRRIKPYLTKYYGNPSSVHKEGRVVQEAINKARKQVADILNCSEEEIFFTSGASESNSWVLKSGGTTFSEGNNHPSIEMGIKKNSNKKMNRYVFSGINSETGKEGLGLEQVMKYITDENWIHADLTQYIGKYEIDMKVCDWISTASFSGHKFGALKGVGVLYIKKEFQPLMKPLIYGHQQNEMRGGTENVVGIISLGEALAMAQKNRKKNMERIKRISNYIFYELKDSVYYITNNNGIINITFNELNASSAVMILDRCGVAVSAGSACNSGNDEPSMALIKDGHSVDTALRTIRVSIGCQNTIREAKKFCKILKKIIDKYD